MNQLHLLSKQIPQILHCQPHLIKGKDQLLFILQGSELHQAPVIFYRPGKENAAPDTLTRACCAAFSSESPQHLHKALCHPGVTRMAHFVRSRNLFCSLEEVKKMTASCSDCAELKPKYHKPTQAHLIKATQPFELREPYHQPLRINTCQL